MKVLTVYAHHDPQVLLPFGAGSVHCGLAEAGHTSDVVDLYAIKFDPVFGDARRGQLCRREDSVARSWLMDLQQKVLEGCRGPIQRWMAARALRGSPRQEIAAFIRQHMPKDVREQQEKVAWADGSRSSRPFTSATFRRSCAAGSSGCSPTDSPTGSPRRHGVEMSNGRLPLLHHRRALIMTSTLFDQSAYDAGIRDAMDKVIDEWTFRYPGIRDVEHVYFYAAATASPETIAYLDLAYALGRDFDRVPDPPGLTRRDRPRCHAPRGTPIRPPT